MTLEQAKALQSSSGQDEITLQKTGVAPEGMPPVAQFYIPETPHAAIPSKTYYVRADPAQYDFCLHANGL